MSSFLHVDSFFQAFDLPEVPQTKCAQKDLASVTKLIKSAILAPMKKLSKLGLIEHILLRPHFYLGNMNPTQEERKVYDEATRQSVLKKIKYLRGFIKVFTEILDNQKWRQVN